MLERTSSQANLVGIPVGGGDRAHIPTGIYTRVYSIVEQHAIADDIHKGETKSDQEKDRGVVKTLEFP